MISMSQNNREAVNTEDIRDIQSASLDSSTLSIHIVTKGELTNIILRVERTTKRQFLEF